jgi:1,2-phenylacetyl-CoA epoxidase PaaB subunit
MPDFRVTFSRTNTGEGDAPESQLVCTVRARDEEQALRRARAYWLEEPQPVDEFTNPPTVVNMDEDE